MTDDKAPPLSVVMSVYNGRRYLRQAVESILTQTFRDFEFIIIDDGSTDESPAMLDAYARGDSRVKVIHQANTGLTYALNVGILASHAPLIARMDADDISHPTRFEKQMAYMATHPRCAALGTAVRLITRRGDVINIERNPTDHATIEKRLLEGAGGIIRHPAAMLRREMLDKIGLYRDITRSSQDLDLYLRLARVGELANLDEPLLDYRIHPASTTANHTDHDREEIMAFMRDAYRERGLGEPPASVAGSASADETAATWNRRWAIHALHAGYRKAARYFALASLRAQPCSVENLRLLWWTLRG